ncbi:MAG: heme o synthase [Holosporales bacterium]
MTADTLHSASTPSPFWGEANLATPLDFIALMKPGVMSLVVFTALVGALLAPGALHPGLMTIAIICIALGSGAAASFNMWYERRTDALMARTQSRPLPAGRMAPEDALTFACLLSLFSVAFLGLATTWAAAAMLAFTIFFYAVVYTMILKPSTPQNIVIGGAAGALPPVVGWLAVSPHFDPLPWTLFLMIFLWTPPHFWALALHRHEDYIRAGIPMLPAVAGKAACRNQIIFYSVLTVGSSYLPLVFLPQLNGLYGVGATLLNTVFLVLAFAVKKPGRERDALMLFFYSILYLFGLFGLLTIAHWRS